MIKFTVFKLINIKYVVAMLAIILFTCLTVGLSVEECGCIFSLSCRSSNQVFEQMTGLMATALSLFIIAAIISVVAVFKFDKWIVIVNFVVILCGAVLMLAGLAIYYRDNHFWASLMGGIAMTLSFETAAFLLIELLTKGKILVVKETLPQ